MPVPLETRETPSTRAGWAAALATWSTAQFVGWGALVLAAQSVLDEPRVEAVLDRHTAVGAYLGMSLARIASQIFWATFLQPYEMPVGFAMGISAFNTVFDGVGLAALLYGTSRAATAPLDAQDWGWIALFAAGVLLERIPEVQRAMWKADPRNKGKPHTGGLFHFLVHANYTGYTLWRVALIGFTRQPLLQLLNVFVASQFRGEVTAQHDRNAKKYGKAFEEYYARTYKLIPFVW